MKGEHYFVDYNMVKPDCCLTGLSSAIACSSELDPGLLGKAFGCRFLQSAKGYSSENSLSGKGEHFMDSQAVF